MDGWINVSQNKPKQTKGAAWTQLNVAYLKNVKSVISMKTVLCKIN